MIPDESAAYAAADREHPNGGPDHRRYVRAFLAGAQWARGAIVTQCPACGSLMKLCTCAVVTGGHRVPHAACPVHGDTREKAD